MMLSLAAKSIDSEDLGGEDEGGMAGGNLLCQQGLKFIQRQGRIAIFVNYLWVDWETMYINTMLEIYMKSNDLINTLRLNIYLILLLHTL